MTEALRNGICEHCKGKKCLVLIYRLPGSKTLHREMATRNNGNYAHE
jgi:hypothetical protein